MPYLPNLLSLFSVNTGMSDIGIVRSLNGKRLNPDRRELDGLRSELLELYADPNTNWAVLLDNEINEILPEPTAEEARSFVTQRIWNVLFPEEKR